MSRKFGMERKGLLLEGWNHKIEDKQVPGMYIYIYIYMYIRHILGVARKACPGSEWLTLIHFEGGTRIYLLPLVFQCSRRKKHMALLIYFHDYCKKVFFESYEMAVFQMRWQKKGAKKNVFPYSRSNSNKGFHSTANLGVFACCCHWRHFHLVSDEELATYSTLFPGYLL